MYFIHICSLLVAMNRFGKFIFRGMLTECKQISGNLLPVRLYTVSLNYSYCHIFNVMITAVTALYRDNNRLPTDSDCCHSSV